MCETWLEFRGRGELGYRARRKGGVRSSVDLEEVLGGTDDRVVVSVDAEVVRGAHTVGDVLSVKAVRSLRLIVFSPALSWVFSASPPVL